MALDAPESRQLFDALNEYILRVADRIARNPHQPAQEREVELYENLRTRINALEVK